jgi:hypothetical protein
MDRSDPPPTLLWEARAAIYAHFAATGTAPTAAETAATLGTSDAAATDLYRALHDRHAILLEPDGARIRMANPFSAIPTSFRITIGSTRSWANCAWDALGIPAALRVDAEIRVDDPLSGAPLALRVVDRQAFGDGLVHFLLPFRRWYDDLVET